MGLANYAAARLPYCTLHVFRSIIIMLVGATHTFY